MGGVFISSRRSDSEGHASRLIDRLSDRFGADQLFRDIDTIEPGATFIDKLNRALDMSSVLIAVIGTSWLSVTDATGRRLLDDPDDLIRLEIRMALERGIPVIPVLVQDTAMPAEADLPDDLKPLARRNAVAMRASEWEGDLAHLLDLVEQFLHLPPLLAVPADAADGTVVLKFDILIDGIVVSRLRLDVEISSRAAGGEQATVVAEPAHTAFASYSSADRDRVLDRVAAVRIAAGLDIFLDCLDLRPSEEWKPQLDAEIKKRDIFLLFWSTHAKESPWVAWEWQTALHDKGKEQMQIHPLEPNVKPPEELADLHFGDVYMWVRTGYEATRPPSPGT